MQNDNLQATHTCVVEAIDKDEAINIASFSEDFLNLIIAFKGDKRILWDATLV